MSSSSYPLIVVTTSSPSYQLGYKSALALSGVKVPCVAYELPTEQVCLIVSSQKLSTDHAFLATGSGILSSINKSY